MAGRIQVSSLLQCLIVECRLWCILQVDGNIVYLKNTIPVIPIENFIVQHQGYDQHLIPACPFVLFCDC